VFCLKVFPIRMFVVLAAGCGQRSRSTTESFFFFFLQKTTFVVALKRVVLNSSIKSRCKIFLNFSYEEELTTNSVSGRFHTKSFLVSLIQKFKIPGSLKLL